MKKSELLQKLSQQLTDEITEPQAEALLGALRKVPQCNKCGEHIPKGEKHGTTKVDVCWGYNSTGKDMDRDKWRLCRKCTDEFQSKHDPMCSMCHKSIVVVMAELSAKNPHCSFYGSIDRAINYYRSDRHCGLEYATVSGRTVCEICYENFISGFKIPIVAGSYHPFDGNYEPGEGNQQTNRIQSAFEYVLSGDSISDFYETHVDYETAVKLRAAKDATVRIYRASFRESCADLLKRQRQRDPNYEDTVTLGTGDGKYCDVPRSYIEKAGGDPKQPKILRQGNVIAFGGVNFYVADLLTKFGVR